MLISSDKNSLGYQLGSRPHQLNSAFEPFHESESHRPTILQLPQYPFFVQNPPPEKEVEKLCKWSPPLWILMGIQVDPVGAGQIIVDVIGGNQHLPQCIAVLGPSFKKLIPKTGTASCFFVQGSRFWCRTRHPLGDDVPFRGVRHIACRAACRPFSSLEFEASLPPSAQARLIPGRMESDL